MNCAKWKIEKIKRKLVLGLATLALAATVAAEKPGSSPPPEETTRPPEIGGGLAEALRPQGDQDLERTREELYGRALSAEEHQRITSWRTWDAAWWQDGTRHKDLGNTIAGISQVVRSESFGRASSALASAESRGQADLLGLEIAAVDEAFESPDGSKHGAIVVRFDGQRRPDLVSFYEVLTQTVEAALKDRKLFLEIIGRESISSANAITTSIGAQSGSISQSDLTAIFGAYLKTQAFEMETYTRLLAKQWSGDASSKTFDDFKAVVDSIDGFEHELIEQSGSHFLSQLPTDVRDRLVRLTVQRAQNTQITAVIEPQEVLQARFESVRSLYNGQ